ncbi:hypothetical protein [Chitinophaga varians]|uniref:hypothetical protein n=1 Tax=Chitinophaga varians TaxID=2202339 RepID=UPI00165F3E90|nr:hypothetical protein [Chitinophaga varians]MBC9911826.1 hypothetical protein [Chitinophaga varians]
MEPLRFNIFRQAHKGLRLLLHDTILVIQHADFAVAREGAFCMNKVQQALQLFYLHAELEDHEVFPLVRQEAATVVDFFERQHARDEELTLALHCIIEKYHKQETPQGRIATGIDLLHEFVAFAAFNLDHMNLEETLLLPFLWMKYTDDELRAAAVEAVKKIPADKNELFIPWMLRGNGNAEVLQWLMAVRAGSPAQVYERLRYLAEKELEPQRWSVLAPQLSQR